jgi:hypothetical protein
MRRSSDCYRDKIFERNAHGERSASLFRSAVSFKETGQLRFAKMLS